MKLSIIIPAFNEEKRLGPHLGPVLDFLEQNYPNYELIIVDDGSQDATSKTVQTAINKEPRAKLIAYQPNKGKGYAVRQGVMAATGDSILIMDADLSTPLSEIPKIVKKLENADIVIGSRYHLEANVSKSAPLIRRAASMIFDQIKYLIVGLRKYKDTQCGFKIFRADIAKKLFKLARVDRFMWDVEILYLAQKFNYKITELPVTWADMPDSKVRFWAGVYQMFRDLWRIRQMHSHSYVEK
jgi:dolichyl-phosphate beta-glucosyltransferase